MKSKDNKNYLFFSFIVILIITNVLSDQNHNISKLYNESISSLSFNSDRNQTKLSGQTNGRMRSFLAEEEEEPLHLYNSFDISEAKNESKLNSSQELVKDSKNTYLYPIFNYQNEITSDDRVEDIYPKVNNTKTDTKSNDKPKRAKYGYKNNSKVMRPRLRPKLANSLFQTENSFQVFDNISNIVKSELKLNESQEFENKNSFERNNSILESNDTKYTPNERQLHTNTNDSLETQKLLKYKDNNLTERFCISSTDCDIQLNERCIDRHKYSVCGCKEPFFREKVSQKCQMKKLIRLLFKVWSNYSNNLNTNSIELIQTKYIIERNIWSLIMNSSHLLSVVDNIKVIEFIKSKIVVDFYVKIANPSNNFHHKYIEYHFWYRLMSIIKDIDFNTNRFDSIDLRAVEIIDDINYCSVKELNYCSDSALCFENNNSDVKFECKCKSGLTDLSPNVNFKGEICALKCNSDFCGAGGICEVRNDTQIHCICMNWKFGDRCQYSFYAFLSVASLLVIISIFFSVCLASLYCGCKIHQEFNKLTILVQVFILITSFIELSIVLFQKQNHSNLENSLPLI